jgi:hypothetical protein
MTDVARATSCLSLLFSYAAHSHLRTVLAYLVLGNTSPRKHIYVLIKYSS